MKLARIRPEQMRISFLAFLFIWQLKATQASGTKYKVAATKCLNLSLSVWQKPRPSVSLIDCFVSSRSFRLNSVGVVQRNGRDASCALFHFGEVCQLLNLINISSLAAAVSESESNCMIVVDSEYDAVAANEHFHAVWVGDRGPALENLVCGSEGQRNPMRSWNVLWTSEGARMDGVSSRLWTDDPTGLDFSASFTWLLHLKRTPRNQCFLELANCGAVGAGMDDHFWEYSAVSGVIRPLYLNPGWPKLFQTDSVLPTDPKQFFIAGVSFNRSAGQCRFFLGSAFLAEAVLSFDVSNIYTEAGACIKVGWRSPTGGLLKGVVRAVAVATNSALTDVEIRKLFQL